MGWVAGGRVSGVGVTISGAKIDCELGDKASGPSGSDANKRKRKTQTTADSHERAGCLHRPGSNQLIRPSSSVARAAARSPGLRRPN